MRPAFSLVELSALGSLAAAGLAVLVPALHSPRQQDRLAGCLANLRSIGSASSTYAAEDPNEYVIPIPNLAVLPPGVGTFEWGGKAGQGEPSMPGNIITSYFGTASFRGPAHRPLNLVLYKSGITDWNPAEGTPQPGAGGANYIRDTRLDLDVYRCPADTGYAGGGFYYNGGRNREVSEQPFITSGLSAYDHYGNSFVANTLKTGSPGIGAPVYTDSPFFMSVSRIPSTGRTVVFQEVPSRSVWLWGDWSDPSCAFTNRGEFTEGDSAIVPGWHGQDFHFNVTFVDGHAATVEMKGCFRPPPNLGSAGYPSVVCGGSLYECYRCITIRGPAWQLDILPAHGVPTPWLN